MEIKNSKSRSKQNLKEIEFMKLAIRLARKGINPSPNPKVGALIMKDEKSELVVIFTVDPKKDLERAFMGFTIATAALATELKVKIFFALDGIKAVTKGYLEGLGEEGFVPLQELFDIYLEEGGEVIVCHPFIAKRNITENDLIDGVILSAAPSLICEAANAQMITI